jgi:hypothetical protein
MRFVIPGVTEAEAAATEVESTKKGAKKGQAQKGKKGKKGAREQRETHWRPPEE